MRRAVYYILNGHETVALTGEEPVLRWGEWFVGADRRVAFSDLGFATVSTVFLGIDHNHWSEGAPVLFESMVFANPKCGETFPDELDGMMNRYATWDEAEAGHAEMVSEVRQKFWRQRSA